MIHGWRFFVVVLCFFKKHVDRELKMKNQIYGISNRNMIIKMVLLCLFFSSYIFQLYAWICLWNDVCKWAKSTGSEMSKQTKNNVETEF